MNDELDRLIERVKREVIEKLQNQERASAGCDGTGNRVSAGSVAPGSISTPGDSAAGIPPVPPYVPVAVSGRHVHLSEKDLVSLFGEGYRLTELKPLSQPGQFACRECVTLVGPKGVKEGVRILGPARNITQVEISITDGFALGLKIPVRDSGDLAGSPGLTIVGPRGAVTIKEGVIAAARHIHIDPENARIYGLKDKDRVRVQLEGVRSLVFENVLVRVSRDYALEMHIDTDEANAANLGSGGRGKII